MGFSYFNTDNVRNPRGFYLVQRIRHAPYKDFNKKFPDAKVKSNPFGYGRLGDYELDYMGSAEFEFGEIPAAYDRFSKGAPVLAMNVELEGDFFKRPLDIVYLPSEGEPYQAMQDWVADGMDGKEPPFDFKQMMTEPDYKYGSAAWWALGANVMWAFSGTEEEPGHLVNMLNTMSAETLEFLR